ncbi:hypothetical protein NPX13_g5250 [Xylaria arbuscula]|uniref:Uncharacterized protein n=1 Tax=Xylaria arbuscula TaxID=114810 RepID=A0A9W8TL65_9PEZI|nr:hypothetical protein NPX13_g5250 [Xylaria arbuscula]
MQNGTEGKLLSIGAGPSAFQQGALIPGAIVLGILALYGLIDILLGFVLIVDKELGKDAQVKQLTAPLAALGIICEDTEDVGEIAEAGEKEEENTDALGRLATEVEKELGQSRTEVECSTQPTEYLAPEIEHREPTCNASGAYHQDSYRVPDE